jgi:hypothetical protein
MGILKIISSFISVFLLWFKTKLEKDAEIKKEKEDIRKEAVDAIKKKDISAVNSIIQRANRLP